MLSGSIVQFDAVISPACANHGPRSLEPLIGVIVKVFVPETKELAEYCK